MTTTKQKAIELFERQRTQIHDFVINDKAWITFTADLITKYIGNHTNQYYNLNEWSKKTGITDERLAREKREEVDRILHYCIQYITDNGVLKTSEPSDTFRLSNPAVLAVMLLIIALSWTVGMYTGQHIAESNVAQDKIELQREINRLREDSVKIVNWKSEFDLGEPQSSNRSGDETADDVDGPK